MGCVRSFRGLVKEESGVVYKGRHLKLDVDVAIKFLHPDLTQEAGVADRFLREARLAARIDSPAISAQYTIAAKSRDCITLSWTILTVRRWRRTSVNAARSR